MSDIEMPDFDKMTPEEIQLWMESLAKKQGATEGLITSADMEIADIDPNSVVIDEPGYVPSETFKSKSTREQPAAKREAPAAKAEPKVEPKVEPKPEPKPEPAKPAEPVRPAAVMPPPPAAPAAPPVTSTPPRGSGERVRLPTERPDTQRPVERPAASVAPLVTPPPAAPPPQPPPQAPAPAAAGGDLAWLESLAAGLPDDGLNLDLSGIASEPAPTSAPRAEETNPESWLESLVNAGGELGASDFAAPVEPIAPPPAAPVTRAVAYEEPPSWLDSLSQSAELESDSRSDSRPAARMPAPAGGADPTEWLSSLSASGDLGEAEADMPSMLPTLSDEGVEEESGTMQDIEAAIREGRVSSEQMQVWLDRQTDMLVQQPEISLDDFYDPDAPPVPADLPDWFLESVSPPKPGEPEPSSETPSPALLESLFEPEAAVEDVELPAAVSSTSEMPEWLKADPNASSQPMDFDSIFVDTSDEGEESEKLISLEPQFEVEYDPSDTWAEAFDLEQDQGSGDASSEPDWYKRNVSDPNRIAAVEALASESPASLMDASLPLDEELSAGQRTNAPAWLTSDAAPAVTASAPTVGDVEEDVPEWLRQTAEASIDPEMPAWLVETIGYEEPAAAPEPEPVPQVVTPPPAPRPSPIRSQPTTPPPAPPPAPKPQVVISGDALQALEQARSLSRESNLEGGLQVYEGLIRQSAALDDVVGDLEGLVRLHRTNPAVYRVLGDGLMRQGKLQQALDTYREALNQL
ncbi:MAG: hypothetical protein U0670_04705 [Anaerolineae bacterium]